MKEAVTGIFLGLAILVIVVWLNRYLYPELSEADILQEIDNLDAELSSQETGRFYNSQKTSQLRSRIAELVETLRKRGKKICRRDNGSLFIESTGVACKQ